MPAALTTGGLVSRGGLEKRIGFGPAARWGYSWLAMPKKRQPQRRRNFLKSLSTASAGVVLAGHSPAVLAAAAPAIGPVPQRKFGRHTQMVSSLALGGATLAKASSVEEA